MSLIEHLRRHWQPVLVLVVGLARVASVISVVRLPSGTAVLLDLATAGLFGLVCIAALIRVAYAVRVQPRLAVQLVMTLAVVGAGRYVAPDVGFALRDRMFRTRLPAFRQAVETYSRMPSQARAEVSVDSLPLELKGLVNGVFTFGGRDGKKVIWFFYGVRAPMIHRAWIYHPDSAVTAATLRGEFWRRVRPLDANWYDAVD